MEAGSVPCRRRSLTELPQDCVDKACTFLTFRTLCHVRRCCRKFNAAVTGESFWAQMCSDGKISGKMLSMLEFEASAHLKEPHPLRFLSGPPEPCANTVIAWQLLRRMLSVTDKCMHGCTHLTQQRREAFLSGISSGMRKQRQRIGRACDLCESKVAKFICVDCFGYFCDRGSGRGCMASHMHEDLGSAKSIGMRLDQGGMYCYTCEKEFAPEWWSGRGDSRALTTAEIQATQQACLRDPRESTHHFGLFQRNQCPHIDDTALLHLQSVWSRQAKNLCNGHCSSSVMAKSPHQSTFTDRRPTGESDMQAQCNSMRTWLCLTCCRLFCNDEPEFHLNRHMEACSHFVVIALRTLNCWCSSCDRYVGLGGSEADYSVGNQIRSIVCSPRLLYQHKEFVEQV